MAHTIKKHIYNERTKKHMVCEVLVMDEEERVPGTDRRELILECHNDKGEYINLGPDSLDFDTEEIYCPEDELIKEYNDFDFRE